MTATRTKKTISFNPLDVSATPTNKRNGVLSGVSEASASAARSPKVSAKDPFKKVGPVAKAQKSVKSARTSVESKPEQSNVPKEPAKRRAKAATPVLHRKPTRKAAAPAPVEKPTRKAATAHTQDDVVFSASVNPDDEKKIGRSASDHDRVGPEPVAQSKDGQVLNVCDIVSGPQSDVVGFYESSGDFVSLMHLEGPIDPPRVGFFSLALAGFAVGGPLGFAAASILSVRKHSIFLARQACGQHRYVSLDLRGLSHLRRMAVKLGR
jgi:hypothetical protein